MLLGTYLEPLRSHPCIEGALLPQNHTTFQVRGLRIISTRSHFLSSTFVPCPFITSDRIGFSILGGSHLVSGVFSMASMGGTEVKYVARPKEGDVAYVSGAAGATGLIACHTFKHLGCRVIGSAGSKEKVGILGGKLCRRVWWHDVTCGSKHVVTSLKDPKRWKQDERGKLRCRCRNLFVNQTLFFLALFERLL